MKPRIVGIKANTWAGSWIYEERQDWVKDDEKAAENKDDAEPEKGE